MNVFGYPQPGKAKSAEIVGAFVQGAGGQICVNHNLWTGIAAAFYGTIGIEQLFDRARARGDWYYLDNAFLDAGRGRFYRVGVDRLQGPLCAPDRARAAALGVKADPWTRGGRHVLVCPQSDYFMENLARWPGGTRAWEREVLLKLRGHTDREIRVRSWAPDKIKLSKTLAEDLVDCWAVVTHSSAAAIEALLRGIPVFTTGGSGAYGDFANQYLSQIEAPVRPHDSRDEWAARLAASQWTLAEMRAGDAWRALKKIKQEQEDE